MSPVKQTKLLRRLSRERNTADYKKLLWDTAVERTRGTMFILRQNCDRKCGNVQRTYSPAGGGYAIDVCRACGYSRSVTEEDEQHENAD